MLVLTLSHEQGAANPIWNTQKKRKGSKPEKDLNPSVQLNFLRLNFQSHDQKR